MDPKKIDYPTFGGEMLPSPTPRLLEPYTGPLPTVLHYSVIVRPKPPLKQIGRIALADRTKRANLATETVGQILGMGANAFRMDVNGCDMKAETNWPKVGDWVIYRQNAGQRLRLRSEMDRVKALDGSSADEVHLLLMSDSDIVCKIPESEVHEYFSWV